MSLNFSRKQFFKQHSWNRWHLEGYFDKIITITVYDHIFLQPGPLRMPSSSLQVCESTALKSDEATLKIEQVTCNFPSSLL